MPPHYREGRNDFEVYANRRPLSEWDDRNLANY
jgi:hypothetical protein